MTPAVAEALREAAKAGVWLAVEGGRVVARPAGRLPSVLRAPLWANRDEVRTVLSNPREAAFASWEAALREVAAHWKAHAATERATGRKPRWFDDEKLTVAVRDAIKATTDGETLGGALELIEAWRSAWARLRDVQAEPPEGIHQVDLFTEAPMSAIEFPRDDRDRTRATAAAGERG